jgi:hypothetical protein
VAAGQVVSAVVTGGADQSVRIEFVAPDGGTVIASADSPTPGIRAILQSVRVSTAGQYAIRVIAMQGSGSYDLGVVVNAAIEEEVADTATNLIVNGNDTPESAQSIDGTAVAVDGAGDRLADVGGVVAGAGPGAAQQL